MLLAFDTATPHVTVALHDGRDVLVERESALPMKHGEQLAPLVDEVLRVAGIGRADLTGIAVGVGPGPFTGLRVGLVTARTLGYVLDLPVHGVCTLDVLAAEAAEAAAGGLDEPFVVATDARRKEVYVASYTPDGRPEGDPLVARPAAVATQRPGGGAGGVLYPDAFPGARGPVRPSAGWLARCIAERRVEPLPPEPLYLRRPDAVAPGARKPVS